MDRVTVFTVVTTVVPALSAMTVAAEENKAASAKQQSAETRDWSAIDINKDHSISPEEMERYLKEVWAKQGKKP